MKLGYLIGCYFTLCLTACGGASSDSTSNQVTAIDESNQTSLFSLSVSNTLNMDEGSSAEFLISTTNSVGNVSFTVTPDEQTFIGVEDYQLSVDNISKTISLSVGDIEQDKSVNITLTATDDEGSQLSEILTVSIINTSQLAKIIELNALKNSIFSIYALQEESDLINVLTTLALFNNDLDATEIDTYKSNFYASIVDNSIPSEVNLILDSFDTSDEAMSFPTNYIESEVDDALTAVYEKLSAYVIGVNLIINDVQNEIGAGIVSEITLNGFYFNASKLSISQFYGNPDLGVWGTSNEFNNEYVFLEKIVFPEDQICTE